MARIETAPDLGHPYGAMELVPADTPLTELIDALQERKLLVDGEVTQELTQDGRVSRASVRFSPKESVVSKIINRFKVKVDITTRFFGG